MDTDVSLNNIKKLFSLKEITTEDVKECNYYTR